MDINPGELPSDVDAIQFLINSSQEKAKPIEKSPYESYLKMVTNNGFIKQYEKIHGSGIIANLTVLRFGYSEVTLPNLFLIYGEDRNKKNQIQLFIRQEDYSLGQGGEAEKLKMKQIAQSAIPLFSALKEEAWQNGQPLMGGGSNHWLNWMLPVSSELLNKHEEESKTILFGIAGGLDNFRMELDKKPHKLFSNSNHLIEVTKSLQTATLEMMKLVK